MSLGIPMARTTKRLARAMRLAMGWGTPSPICDRARQVLGDLRDHGRPMPPADRIFDAVEHLVGCRTCRQEHQMSEVSGVSVGRRTGRMGRPRERREEAWMND